MLTVAKKSEDEMRADLCTELGFLTSVASFDGEPLALDGYQLAFLQNQSKYRWVVKARQVGFSFLFACEAIARCHLRDGQTSIFVSYALSDAVEKVNYARQLYEELPLAYRKRLVTDSKTELGFESNGASKRISRIISVPSKAPRGKKGDLYLDELAHYANDREVYKGSTALILRARGQLTGCSSPLGRRGVFWEIAEEELRPYPTYSRQYVPWWLCRFFSRDVAGAAREAADLPTEERVRRFGKPGIQDQFDSLALEDFQQEFELEFCDESYSFYPYELILPCTSDGLATYSDFQAFPSPIRGRLTAGFDVGRKRDLSELVIVEEIEGTFHLRLWRSYDRVPFAEQEADLDRMLDTLPIARLSIDQGGIGVLEPDVVDAQNDRYSKEEVRRACHRFAEFYLNAGLMHRELANGRIVILENYLAPCDFVAENGEPVKEGTWLQGRGYRDDEIWQKIRNGELTGLSIGGSAIRKPIENAKGIEDTSKPHESQPMT